MRYKDYTLKARIAGKKPIEDRLLSIGAAFIGLDVQTDTYFSVPNGKLKLRQGTLGSLITHYERTTEDGAERTVVHKYEPNPSTEAIDKLMEGHERIGVVEKERSIYDLNSVRIHLDKLPNGEVFVEVEAMDREGTISEGELKAEALRVSQLIGILPEAIVPTGYLAK